MNIIPNVYQAAYMEGLTKKNGGRGGGIFNIDNLPESKTKKLIKQAFDLGLSSARPYTVEITPKADIFGGYIYAVQTQEDVANVLKKREIDTFPRGSIWRLKNRDYVKNVGPVTMSGNNVSNFMRKSFTKSFEFTGQRGAYHITIDQREGNKNDVTINKSDLFNLNN